MNPIKRILGDKYSHNNELTEKAKLQKQIDEKYYKKLKDFKEKNYKEMLEEYREHNL